MRIARNMTADEKDAVRDMLEAWGATHETDTPTDMDLFWWNYGAELAENNLYSLCRSEHGDSDGALRADYLFNVAIRWERIHRPAGVLTR